MISNIDHTLEMFLTQELNDNFQNSFKDQEEALKNSYEVRIIEEALTKGLINARIIASKLDTNKMGVSFLAKLAIMGNMSKESEEKDQISVPALVIRPGTPVSDISGRDLPSPAEIRSDNNVMLLPFY